MKAKILKHLGHHPWAELLQVHEVLDSTNTYAKELARQGVPEGTVVIAQSQTGGRGRLGRSFHSPHSGLYLSLILRPNCPADELMHLTCAVAVAACDAVEQTCGLRPGIKWINDLLMDGKKLGGILTELIFDGDGTVSAAVIGIGINCHSVVFPKELQNLACCLSEFTDRTDSCLLAANLILNLSSMNQQLFSHRERIMECYRQNCVTLGKQVRVISPTGVETGVAQRLNNDGSLTVLFDNGQRQNVNSGEVSVRGFWDYI